MIDTLFKVGDKVKISPGNCTEQDLWDYGSSGTIGSIYIIIDIDINPYKGAAYKLKGSNWHREDWLVPYFSKNIIGGELL